MSMLKQKSISLRRYIARRGLFIRVPIPSNMRYLEPEINLGRSILDRAVLDSVNDPEIYDWFNTDDEWFETICFIAFLDPEKTVEYFQETYHKLQNNYTIQKIYSEREEDYDRY